MRVLAALAAVLLTTACGADDPVPRAAAEGPFAYRTTISIDITPDPQEGCEEKRPESTEWVGPTTGWWRREETDCSGSRNVFIYSGRRYSSSYEGQPTSVRIGSAAFIGPNVDDSVSLRQIRPTDEPEVGDVLSGVINGVAYSVTVEERIPLAEATRRGLFTVNVEEGGFFDRELEPGAVPTLPVKAYWFGHAFAGRQAFVAIELRNDDGLIHTTCYETPAEIAAGKTHCLASRGIPEEELQVVSQALTGKLAKRELARLERTGSGRTVRLANGERALLYPRALVTEETLITVVGRIDLADHIEKLRPL